MADFKSLSLQQPVVKTNYCVNLPEGTFGLILPKTEMTLMGVDLKILVVPTDQTECLDLIMESRNNLPVLVEAGQILGQFLVITQCPLRWEVV